ncbi:hypothetical protein SAMN06297164_0851 [Nitrosomonas ureae]|uniref:PBP superfamily domain-containing protein n=1 Tax=Nitrosomonas ureae TaxID=44577 RepID=A0A286A4R5_9PROT|nr:hypothetical protein SAMN06297164_0851 [Nitrosomonas ureae]
MNLFHFSIQARISLYCLSRARLYFGFALFICFLGVKADVRANDHYEIVTNLNVSETALTVNSLRSIFSMSLKTWPDGTKIRVFVLSDEDKLHKTVSKEKLNVFPYQLRSTWDRLVFSGTGQAPIRVNSIEEMRDKVVNTPGAIGYLWRANIDENVNVLQIK